MNPRRVTEQDLRTPKIFTFCISSLLLKSVGLLTSTMDLPQKTKQNIVGALGDSWTSSADPRSWILPHPLPPPCRAPLPIFGAIWVDLLEAMLFVSVAGVRDGAAAETEAPLPLHHLHSHPRHLHRRHHHRHLHRQVRHVAGRPRTENYRP